MAVGSRTVRAGRRGRGPKALGTTSLPLALMAVLAVAGGLGLGPAAAFPLGRDPKERGGACPRKGIEKEAKGGLLEYSVIYTDRATNSRSPQNCNPTCV